MSTWQHWVEKVWRKDVMLPIGRVVIEIHKRRDRPWYSTAIAVAGTGERTPRALLTHDCSALSLRAARRDCEALIRLLCQGRDR